MSGRKILSLVLAVVVGIVALKIAVWMIGAIFGLFWWLVGAAITVGVIYFLYRGFNNMLASGKRLT